MKIRKFIAAAVLLLAAGCSAHKPHDTGAQSMPALEGTPALYYAHAVNCLDKDHASVDRVLEQAGNSSGVVLYFHGGLSSRDYMEKKLGPWLLASLFTGTNLGNGEAPGLYPVFVNYDAGIMDLKPIENLLKTGAIEKIAEKIRKRLEGESAKTGLKAYGGEQWYSPAAASLLRGGTELKALGDDEKNDIAEHLKNEKLTEALERELEKGGDLRDAAAEMNRLFTAHKGEENFKADSGVFTLRSYIVVFRILARLALQTNHQFEPTVLEEVVRALGIFSITLEDAARAHWDKVYDHGRSCWHGENNGRYLIDKLLAMQAAKEEKNEGFTINTLSHSAGSIPVAYLVDYVSRTEKAKLDTLVMIAPAINQQTFVEDIVQKKDRYGKFRAFVLDLKKEEEDNVAYIYRASLLYFVSGVAEKTGWGDKLLLIGQHLDPDREPYRTKWYRKIMKEDPWTVWNYFKEDPGRLSYYGSGFAPPDHDAKAETHECTKYPWATRDLARRILKELGSPATDVSFPVPKNVDAGWCR